MEYPILNVKQKYTQMTDAFLGYNHNLRTAESEFYDMKNMTSDYYPVLTPRGKRGIYVDTHDVNGIIAKDTLCYVDGTDFVIRDIHVDMGLSPEIYGRTKTLISMGSYVIIMPDRKYINTMEIGKNEFEHGDIDATFTSTADVKFQMCTLTGDAYENATISATAPSNPKNNQLWIDTSTTPHTLKKYAESSSMWVAIATTYIKVSSPGIAKGFKQYDGVKISGIVGDGASLNGSQALWGCHESEDGKSDYIIIVGILDKVTTQTVAQGKITIERKMPDMAHIVESNNRLWGCKYGVSEDGTVVNEIYACKLGDFKNWNCFMNLSTDSYAASCGTDGPFTGAINHLGYPLFFKENCIHKVYGNYPSNYQIQTTTCRGVQKGSERSLAIVNETLYYKSTNSVCAYDGSLPVEVSTALGDAKYSKAVAGAHGNKYYISMRSADGTYHLFVYDTAKGMWHKEDNLRALSFCSFDNEMYAIDHKKDIITLLGSGTPTEEKVPWMVETGLIGMTLPDMKYISKLQLRMALDVGSNVTISLQYDSIGDWEQVCQMTSTSLRSFTVPILPRRCDHFRIRIDGEGGCKIYSITKTLEQGSDVS